MTNRQAINAMLGLPERTIRSMTGLMGQRKQGNFLYRVSAIISAEAEGTYNQCMTWHDVFRLLRRSGKVLQ